MSDTTRIEEHLAALVRWPGGRPVGSPANHAAEAYIADTLRAAGYEVEHQGFDCVAWRLDGVDLWVGDGPLPVTANPYSPPADVTAPLAAVADLAELEATDLTGRIALLHGALAAEPLFPRNYPFFTYEEHQRIADLLEQKGARAVIAVSPMHGNPAPIIEDGDFGLPSVTVGADVGAVLLLAERAAITLRLRSAARTGRAANVIGRRAHPSRDKLVLSAHFDTKPGTPGALDNAAGVATLLALAERLAGAPPPTNLEFVFFNGEDHYAAPGEVAYIAGCGGEFGRIALVINVDGVGLRDASATVAFFNCPEAWAEATRATMRRRPGIEEIEPWPQGDHSLFAMQGVPCIALTSGGIFSLIDSLIHTPNDTLDRLDPARLAPTVEFLSDLLAQPLPGK